MSQSSPDPSQQGETGNVPIQGGAAILAPIQSFPNGVPANAMVLIPLGPNGAPVEKDVVNGPVALTMEQVWKLLGFNGPAVQVQDDQGRPIAIGLEDLLSGLEKHSTENPDDLDRARIFAQELMKYERHAKAETVLAKVVARGGDGQDWLALGVAQLAQDKHDKAEGTLKGAQNLMKDNPYPSLHLAKLAHAKKDTKAEREAVERAIQIQPGNVDAWAYLFNFIKEQDGEEKAISTIEELANAPVNARTAAPYVALQGFYAADEKTRDKAITYAKKGVDRSPNDPIPLIVLSALYGQAGKIEEIIKLLAPHEALMQQDVRLAHNYFEALFQSKDMDKIKALLNKLATSPNREVKQFAIERSRAIAQMLQQQAQAMAQATAQAK
jgi:tetratricopeptide (TPR) repeat protein